ncbi:DUF6461 domain-containing protein [Streptomyces erythrochromogenes]|uniref:DUF6461 domain-containing protein n=1 Tax=Streptomyces erythrochromogenes TaxID=285574 RepID=UPI0036F63C34
MHSNDTDPGPSTTWADHEIMWCLTVTRGITPTELLTRYGAHEPDQVRPLTRQEAEVLGQRISDETISGTVLRVGTGNGWSFCLEEWGWVGSTRDVLARLSHNTESFSLLKDARGRSIFQVWRDGHQAKRFEPGMIGTRPATPHPWWDALEQSRISSGQEHPGWEPVLRSVSQHTGVSVDNETVNSQLLTVLLRDESQGYGTTAPATRKSLGFGLQLTQSDTPQE